jgi:CheY-like chemotaxis protein
VLVPDVPAAVDLDGVRVLLVEDDRDTLELFRAGLVGCGARVVAVPSAAAALGALTVFRPDVLVTDVGMPVRDGFWLVREIRGLPGLADLPALAVTGVAESGATLGAGFQRCLRKPLELRDLCLAVMMLHGGPRHGPPYPPALGTAAA